MTAPAMSPTALRAALAEQTGEVFLTCLTITHPTFLVPIYLVNDQKPLNRTVQLARTNRLLYAQQFEQSAWGKTNISVTADATTDPFGGSTADKAAVTAAGAAVFSQTAYAPAGSTMVGLTYSIYAKKGSGPLVGAQFCLRNSTTGVNLVYIEINYDTGAITYLAGDSGATVTDAGNGWWQITLTVTSGWSDGNAIVCYAGYGGGRTFAAGDYCYLSSAQLVADTVAGPFILTTSAPVTATQTMTRAFQPFAFDVTLPPQQDDQLPQVQLVIDNVDRSITQAIRTVSGRPGVRLEVVLASQPDTVEAGPYDFSVLSVTYDANAVRGVLGFEDDLLNTAFPAGVYNPGNSAGLFA